MNQNIQNQNPPYKIGVLGAGLIGRKHIEIASAANALHAIIDPQDNARILADEESCMWFATLDEYLDAHKPDGIIIATPNQLHVQHGLSCIKKGIPVLIEKPIADIAEWAEKLVTEAEAANVPILVGHHRRHNPLITAAKAAIEAGKIGEIISVHAQFWLRKPDEYFDLEWRRSKGAGPVFINLIHDIDLLRYLCGEIVQVQAMESNKTRGHDVEDSVVIIAKFESGALGTISVSDAIPAPWSWELTSAENPAYPNTNNYCYTIGGTKGSLSIPDLNLWAHPGKQSWWEPINNKKLSYEAADPLPLQFQHFLDVINGKATPLVSGSEGVQNLHVLEAIKNAAANGMPQDVEISRTD